MSDNFGVYNITGSITLPVSSSVFLSGTNDRRRDQRSAVSQSLTFYPVSSSMHEVTSLNAFFSGTQALETSAVPASASIYYSKQSRLRRLTYKLSASAGMTNNSELLPSVVENYARNTFDPVSGSHRNNSYFNPAVFEIDVPEYGRIRDVKVWVELLHDHRSGPGKVEPGSLSVYRFDTVNSLKSTVGLSAGQYVYIWDVYVPAFICSASISGEFFSGSTNYLDVLDSSLTPADKTSISASFYYEGISFETGSSVYTGNLVIAGPGAFLEAGALIGSTYGGGIGDANRNLKQGLQGLQIALRSPNVNFPYAHPLWNDEQVSSRFKNPDTGQTPELLRGSYLLWGGHAVETDLGQTLGDSTGSFSEDSYFSSEVISSGNMDYSVANRRIDIDTDDEGRSIALFYRSTPNHYVIGDFTNTGWRFFTLADLGSNSSEHCRVRFNEASKQIYAVWQEQTSTLNTLKFAYAANASSSFSTETIDVFNVSVAEGFRGLDFKVQDGVVNCVYATSDGVFLSKRTGVNTWERNQIFVANTLLPSIDFDSNGKTYVGFADYSDNTLKYAVTSSSGISTTTFSVVPYVTTTPGKFQLAVAGDDSIHMMCLVQKSASATYDVVYAKSSSDGLQTSKLFEGGVDTYFPSNVEMKLNKKTDEPEAIITAVDSLSPVRSSIYFFKKGNLGFSTSVVGSSSFVVGGFNSDRFGNSYFMISSGSNLNFVYTTGSVSYLSDGQNRISSARKAKSSLYQSFDTDIDIRTIFSDSSKILNPRSVTIGQSATQKLLIAGSYASPSSASLFTYFKYPQSMLKTFDTTSKMTGSNVPWMLDDRVRPGFLYGRNYSTMTASDGTVSATSSLPPAGWLTGPGNTADVNEWPTSGMSLGPNDIKPVYPLLDDVYVEKIFDEPTKTGASTLDRRSKIVGFRPGLRGTEVHGKWKLLVGNNSGSARDGWWFRQFRLEFTVDSGEDIRYGSTGQRKMLFSKPSYVPQVAGQRIVGYVSGSAAWDIGVNSISTQQREEFGRTVGIVSDKNARSFAVYSAITGSFYGQLSGSGKLESVQRTFLDNEFGTPYIPISSGSFEVPTFDVFDASDAETSRNVFNEVLNPKTSIPKSSTISSHVSRAKVLISTRDEILKKTKT